MSNFKINTRNSVFDKMKVSFFEVFYIMNNWRLNVQGNFISDDLLLGEATISRWVRKFDDMVWNSNHDTVVIGGQV